MQTFGCPIYDSVDGMPHELYRKDSFTVRSTFGEGYHRPWQRPYLLWYMKCKYSWCVLA